MSSKLFVGMSGWTFPDWRGDFYPKGLVQKKELEYASQQVTSIEVNGTFYGLQKPATFQRWYNETPEDFCFAIKAPQKITHIRRLKEVEQDLANFFASGVFCLKHKLGPFLWQFPPNMMLKDDRFEKFLQLLPYDAESAMLIAHKNTLRSESTYLQLEKKIPLRHAFEFRHSSFRHPEFIELLRKHRVAVVFAHAGEKSPYMEDVTADFIYARMHGEDKKFQKGYTTEVLKWWGKRVELWRQGSQPEDAVTVSKVLPKKQMRDVFVYFDTREKVYSPHDAVKFLQLTNKLRAASKARKN